MEQQPTIARRWQVSFFTIWSGQALSILGSQLVQFALIWWLTRTTRSELVLATAALVGLVPNIVLAPFAGALIDRWNRRRVMIVADACVALATAALAVIYALGVVQTWHVYVILLIRAIGGTFHGPAMQASTSLMVPKDWLSRVAGMNQALFGALGIISPPLGAILIEVLPMQAILAIDVSTATLAILPLLFVAIPQPARAAAAGSRLATLWRDMGEGLHYVRAWTGLCLVGVLATVANMLIHPAFAMLPLLVTKHFGAGARELGWISSAWALGTVAGGVTLSAWGGFRRRIITSLSGVMGMGVGFLLIGLAPQPAFWLALGAMLLAGFMNPIANGPLFAVMQSTVAPEMQGRVFTLLTSVAGAVSPLGLIAAAPVAQALGVSTWFLLGGVACLLMGGGGLFVPAIVHLEDGRSPERSAPAVGPAAQV